ncbi:MAG: glutathione S-transferase [Alphaproteobacteria bacterium]|nr:glutathione S-transferase [Alphaproteobacteria bacterium]MCB9699070.1 glutathione S-transferase [Alphaproteobacteria bacterium]
MTCTLYYWPIPFRGQFVRWVLAHAGASWEEVGPGAMKDRPVTDQPVPHMAPPLLVDDEAGVALSQLPAILTYLAGRHGLLPGDPERDAATLKLVCDANDVLDELTRNGGSQMWTREAWDRFVSRRLPRWMSIFEETGRRHGLTADGGTLLGTPELGLADLVTETLWFTMTDKLPELAPLLRDTAPAVAALSTRIAERPPIAALRERTDAAWGRTWCGGQIEASLREMLAG